MDQLENIFSMMIENSGLELHRLLEARLQEEWREIVGDNLSQHLSVHSLDGDRLLLEATDPSWSHQASMLRNKIRKRINEHFERDLVSKISIKN